MSGFVSPAELAAGQQCGSHCRPAGTSSARGADVPLLNYCTDGGRRINNLLPDWPTSLEGFAKRAYELYERDLKPLGFKLIAPVVSYEGEVPGNIVVSRSSTGSWMSANGQ
jgi:hypothetical protein